MDCIEEILKPEILISRWRELTPDEKGYAEVILSFIVRQSTLSPQFDWMDEELKMHSKVLQNFYYQYTQLINYLVRNKIIERSLNYRIGIESYGYTLIDKSYTKGFKKVDGMPWFGWSSKEDFRENLNKYRKAFNEFQFTKFIDQENALVSIDRAESDEELLKGIITFSKTKHTLKLECFKKGKSYPHLVKCMDNANWDKSRKFSIDKQGCRTFNWFTNLPSLLRDCLLINGVKLSNIDIKNSQPQLLLAYLYEKGIVNKKWNKLTKSGEIYEWIMQVCGVERSVAKIIWMKYFFGNNRNRIADNKNKDVTKEMMKTFDNAMHREFTEIRRFVRSNREELALILQYRECKVINNIYTILKQRGLNNNVIFHFDAVYYLENETSQEIKGIIEQELNNIGLIYKLEEKKESGKVLGLRKEYSIYVMSNIKTNDIMNEIKNKDSDYDDRINQFLNETKEKVLEFEF